MGGSATRAYNLAKGLTLNDCKVTVITAFPHYPHGNIPAEYRWKPFKVDYIGNLKVIRTFMPPIKSEGIFKRLLLIGIFTISSLFALPLIGKIDAIWASSWAPGLLYGKLKHVKVAINVDDLTIEDSTDANVISSDSFSTRLAEWVYRFFYVKADIITPISPGYINIISNKYCVSMNKIHVVWGGVDLNVFKPVPKTQFDKNFVIMYSGSFSVAYDFNLIFAAAKIIEAIDDSVLFIIQGKGEQLISMKREANKLRLKNVQIIDKLLSREQVSEFLSQADVLILPLINYNKPYRGISSKLYEYQAVGKPIICCSKGMPSKYIKETKSGIVIKPGDSQSLAEVVLTLKQNPSICKTMSANGRKYVAQKASIEAIGLLTKELFK